MARSILKKITIDTKDLLAILTLTLSLPLFFYKLGQTSLVSWDEAWYADISRHIAQTGDLINLVYNGMRFSDHPPGGFWFSALIFKLFGISEFTARLFSAASGFFCLILTYLLGKQLFNRLVGFSAAISLVSAFWFLYRARAGDLDTPLTLFFLLTLYLALKASVSRAYLIPFSLSLAFLFLIKSMLPLAIVPVLILIFWKSKIYKMTDFLWPVLLIIFLLGGWLLIQGIHDQNLVIWHISHSFRRASAGNDFSHSLTLFTSYLHSGIGKWFWPGILGLVVGLITRQKPFMILAIFVASYSIPFLFSPEVQIWHLIPLYPFLILSFYGLAWHISHHTFHFSGRLLIIPFLLFAVYFSFVQIKAAWVQFIDIPAFVSDEAILSREASHYSEPIFLDGDFDPAGAFYADRPVTKLRQNLPELFASQLAFLLITNNWRLQEANIDPATYTLLKSDRDKVLIRKQALY